MRMIDRNLNTILVMVIGLVAYNFLCTTTGFAQVTTRPPVRIPTATTASPTKTEDPEVIYRAKIEAKLDALTKQVNALQAENKELTSKLGLSNMLLTSLDKSVSALANHTHQLPLMLVNFGQAQADGGKTGVGLWKLAVAYENQKKDGKVISGPPVPK